MGQLFTNERTFYYDDEVHGRVTGSEAVVKAVEDVKARADAAGLADIGSDVTLVGGAYTTLVTDLTRLLRVTAGASTAIINLVSAAGAGNDAIQCVEKVDAGVGPVLIKAAGVVIGFLPRQGDLGVFRVKNGSWDVSMPRGVGGLLAYSSTPLVNPTTDVNEHVVKEIILPGGTLGPNRGVTVDVLITAGANNANVKRYRARLGGQNGTIFAECAVTSTLHARHLGRFDNEGAENVQRFSLSGSGVGGSTTATSGTPVDTSADTTIALTLQCATSAADELVLRHYEVRIVP